MNINKTAIVAKKQSSKYSNRIDDYIMAHAAGAAKPTATIENANIEII